MSFELKPLEKLVESNFEAAKILETLKNGSNRFAENFLSQIDLQARRAETAKGQHPIAIVLTCSDSRVDPCLAFDQSVGDLFVVRNAGNIIEPLALGSVEYAVEAVGVKLFVVLGHGSCGAITASFGDKPESPNLASIYENLQPAIIEAKKSNLSDVEKIEKAASLNVFNQMNEAYENSAIIRKAIRSKRLACVGGYYNLSSGKTEFFNMAMY